MSPIPARFTWSALLLMGTLLASGCASLPGLDGKSLGKVTESTAPGGPICTVEIRQGSKDPQAIDVPLGPETRVQDALDMSNASRKFRNLNVYILRPTPGGPEPYLKLVCHFDRKNRRVRLDSDYALHPQDRIVVTEDRSSPFENAMGSVFGRI